MKRESKGRIRYYREKALVKFSKSIKRKRKKERKRRSIALFLSNARKHSIKKGEAYYIKKRHSSSKYEQQKPSLPPISAWIAQKNDAFSRKRPHYTNTGTIIMPAKFSLIDRPEESNLVLKTLLHLLYKGKFKTIILDYKNCEEIDVDASVCMDILIMEFNNYLRICRANKYYPIASSIRLANHQKPQLLKILCSIGAFSTIKGIRLNFHDLVSYPLCIWNKKRPHDAGIDITEMVDYVQECLSKMDRQLNTDARKNLCDVVGEILINAEEHSTTEYRFSTGYFQDFESDKGHSGIFNLVIFNYGDTIYEKFKQIDSLGNQTVERMKDLSDSYTKRSLFGSAEFTEETLWTLYALQEGVTSVPKERYKKRGNGSIRFIESFFELKGNGIEMDDISKMTILSGNTKITFDGSYAIKSVTKGENTFKVMAFNKDGDIEQRPDKKSVTFVDNFFPGTLISARILISHNDVNQQENEHSNN